MISRHLAGPISTRYPRLRRPEPASIPPGPSLRQPHRGGSTGDRAKITAEARLDGKYRLSTSDPDQSAERRRPGWQEPAGSRAPGQHGWWQTRAV